MQIGAIVNGKKDYRAHIFPCSIDEHIFLDLNMPVDDLNSQKKRIIFVEDCGISI